MNAGNILCGKKLRRGISEPFPTNLNQCWFSSTERISQLGVLSHEATAQVFHENSPADESLLLIVIVFMTENDAGKVFERTSVRHSTKKGPAEWRRKVKGGLKSNYHIFWKRRSQRQGREAIRFKDFRTNVSCAARDFSNPEIVFLSLSRDFAEQPSAYESVLKVKFTPVTFSAWEHPRDSKASSEKVTRNWTSSQSSGPKSNFSSFFHSSDSFRRWHLTSVDKFLPSIKTLLGYRARCKICVLHFVFEEWYLCVGV